MPTTTSTILFTDAVESTSLRTELGETAADALFRDHERRLHRIVTDHHGTVVKTAGDGIMAAFDASTDAVLAAIAVQQHVAGGSPVLQVRIGLGVGDVSWEDGDCYGLPVVVAARLQSAAAPGQIVASALVHQLAGDRSGAQFRALDPLPVRGLAEPIEAYEVDWKPIERTSPAEPFAVALPSALAVASSAPFVGRSGEWATLLEAWTAASAGAPQAVLIGGEAGAGKTRLAVEFARWASGQGAAVAYGACDAELAVPYQPFVVALDHLLRAMPDELLVHHREQFTEMAVLLPQIERRIPGLQRTPGADPDTERYRFFTAVDAMLDVAAAGRPVVVLIDDLHWAGQPTLALLRHLTRSSTELPLLLLATFRDTAAEIPDSLAMLLAELRRTNSARRISLSGLDPSSVEDFVATMVGHDLDRDLRLVAHSLAARTGGNAFYLGELWRQLISSGRVACEGGRWTVRSDADGDGVPESVREVESARLVTLSAPARHVVELMAIGGQRLPLRVVTAASDLAPDALDAGVEELVDARLLVEVGGSLPTYEFVHAIVRDSVAQTVRAGARIRLHHRLALAFESVFEGDRRPVLAELARHFTAAASVAGPAKAVYYARRAAAQAMRSVAYDEAIAHLESALALSPGDSTEAIDLELELGSALCRKGDNQQAMQVFQQAFRAARERGLVEQAVQAAVGFDFAVQMPGLPGDESVRIMSEALELVGAEDSALRARVQASLGLALALAGRVDEAKPMGEASLIAARRHDEPTVIMSALQCAMIYEEDPFVYLALATEVCELALAHNDPWVYCYARGSYVRGLMRLGRVAEARDGLPELREAAERGQFVLYRYQSIAFDVMFALIDGRLDEAEELAERAMAFAAAARTEFGAGVYGVQMYAIRREQGRLEEVVPAMRVAAALQTDPTVWRPGLTALFADVGMFEEARREFETLSSDGFAAVPRDATWPGSLTYLSEVCTALADRERAAVLYLELDAFARQTMQVGFTVNLGPADRLRGNLAALLGRRAEAEQHFTAAMELAVVTQSPVWRARIAHDWAVALAPQYALLREAEELAVQVGMEDLQRRCSRELAAMRSPAGETRAASLPDKLSSREVEVLRLVAQGHSNREIGERLFISGNTVANHVRSVLQKTGTANRAEATAYAARHGLLV